MLEKLKDYFNNNKKKTKEMAIVIGIVGIIILIAGSVLFPGKTDNVSDISASSTSKPNTQTQDMYARMEKMQNDFTDILHNIDGAGKVKVLITYASSVERIPAKNIKESADQRLNANGDSENSSSKDEQIEGGGEVILKEILPKIEGIVVVAEGANDEKVKGNLIATAKVLTNLPDYKIQVIQGK